MASNSVTQITPLTSRSLDRNVAVEPRAASADGKSPAAAGKVVPPSAAAQGGRTVALADAVSELNDYVQNIQRDLQFSIDEASGQTIIKVIDSQSKELIRQIPPEEVLALARNLDQLKDGGILQEKA